MKIDFNGHPKKTPEELDAIYNDEHFLIIEEILESNKTYNVIFQDLLDILKYGFEYKEIRSRLVHYKFHPEDKEFKTMELRHLLSNLILWKPFIYMDKVELLDESFIFDFTKFSSGTLLEYINEKLLPINDDDFASKNTMIDDIYYSIIAIAHAFCLLIGNGVSIHNVYDLEKRIPEVHDIMYKDVDETLEPNEIEDELSRRTSRLIDIMKNDLPTEPGKDNDFRSSYASGAGIKPAQLKEFMIKIGLKADLSGNVIPVMINGSFLLDGLYKPSLFYINALSGRKALIAVKQGMGIPGAFAKKLCQVSTSSGILSQSGEMCNSVATVDYHILDDNFLSLLNGRFYYDSHGHLKCVDYKKDKDLIGKIVRFKSPATCCGKDGICKYCYGKLFDINSSLFSVGAIAALKESEPAQQGVLSTKHSQTTHSNQIKFSKGFDELFELESSEMSLKEDSDLDADLYIVLDDVIEEELDDKIFYYTYGFKIQDAANNDIYHIYEESEAKLYLNDQIIDQYKKLRDKSTPISLENFDETMSLFLVEVKNKELTEPIEIFKKLLNTNEHMGVRTVSEMCQKFAESLISMGQKYDLVHGELIIRGLLRKKSNILEFPDFSANGDPNDYQILRLDTALQYHPSALVSMPYGFLKRQILSTELYKKSAPSHLDTMYAPVLAKYV